MKTLALVLALLPAGVGAQERVSEGRGAVLRALDKISGALTDLEIVSGQTRAYGRIEVSVEDCRFPTGNPAGNAYAHVTVRSAAESAEPLFSGWMVAGAPALNALDNPRYDVWVLRCITS